MRDRSISSQFLSSSARWPALRVAIVIDDIVVPRASADVIRDIAACDFAHIELIAFTGAKSTERPPSRRQARPLVALAKRARAVARPRSGMRPRDDSGALGWLLYSRIDKRRARLPDDPCAPQRYDELLPAVETIHVPPHGSGDEVAPGDLARMHRAALDVVIALPPADLSGAVSHAARYGGWTLRFGDAGRYPFGSDALWEVIEGDPLSIVSLERQGPGTDTPLTLARAGFPTHRTSVARNQAQVLFGASHLVIRTLRRLHEGGWAAVEEHADRSRPHVAQRRQTTRPDTSRVVRWLAPIVAVKARDRLLRLVGRDIVEHWRIAIRAHPPQAVEERLSNLGGLRWIEAPRGRFFADPFAVERDGRTWLFFEDFSYRRKRAVISCAEIAPGGRVREPQVVLGLRKHVSYPCVFFDNGTAYMIPETVGERSVQLYRATEFPLRWELAAQLYDGMAVDTSVWHQDGKWWFFTTVLEQRGGAPMLMLFFADGVTQQWSSHPMNPISVDARSSRNAGALFREGGRLIRPSQDVTRSYGYSFTLNEVLTLTSDRYAERRFVTVEPTWAAGLRGTHTYARSNRIEAIDARVPRRRSEIE